MQCPEHTHCTSSSVQHAHSIGLLGRRGLSWHVAPASRDLRSSRRLIEWLQNLMESFFSVFYLPFYLSLVEWDQKLDKQERKGVCRAAREAASVTRRRRGFGRRGSTQERRCSNVRLLVRFKSRNIHGAL